MCSAVKHLTGQSTANEFHGRLRVLALREPDKRIRLDADENTPFGRVAEVLDICQFRGMTNVGTRTNDYRYNRR